jgi:hypothetical protein
VALEAGGKSVRMGKDGAAPLSLEEWVDQQVSEAPHVGKKRDHATKASNLRMRLTSNGAFAASLFNSGGRQRSQLR